MIGIYKITNPEGKVYIGASKDIEKRVHRGYRNSVGNKSRLITESIRQFGHENHVFEVVEECLESELNERERYYQEYFDCLYPNGLNRNLVSCKGKKQVSSNATKELIRESQLGKTPWNLGIPTWESTKKTIKERYCPLQRGHTKILLDTTTGIYFYGFREASEAFNIPKQTLKMNVTAPNQYCRRNKTNLKIT